MLIHAYYSQNYAGIIYLSLSMIRLNEVTQLLRVNPFENGPILVEKKPLPKENDTCVSSAND